MPLNEEDVAIGSRPLPKLSDHEGEVLLFALETAEVVNIESEYGTGDYYQLEVLRIGDSGNDYETLHKLVIFATVIADTITDALGDGKTWLLGRLTKQGRAFVLEPVTSKDKEWKVASKAVDAFEPFPELEA
jgi:hypothetical protein